MFSRNFESKRSRTLSSGSLKCVAKQFAIQLPSPGILLIRKPFSYSILHLFRKVLCHWSLKLFSCFLLRRLWYNRYQNHLIPFSSNEKMTSNQNKFYYPKLFTFHFWLLQIFFYIVSSSIIIWKNRMKVKKAFN